MDGTYLEELDGLLKLLQQVLNLVILLRTGRKETGESVEEWHRNSELKQNHWRGRGHYNTVVQEIRKNKRANKQARQPARQLGRQQARQQASKQQSTSEGTRE